MARPPARDFRPEGQPALPRRSYEILDQVFNPRFCTRTVRDLFQDGQAHGVGIVPIYAPTK